MNGIFFRGGCEGFLLLQRVLNTFAPWNHSFHLSRAGGREGGGRLRSFSLFTLLAKLSVVYSFWLINKNIDIHLFNIEELT